jgi:hypothetical protein
MTPSEFAERWGTPLIRYRQELLNGCGLNEETIRLLTEAGIPTDSERLGFMNPERFVVTPYFLDFDPDDENQAHLRDLLHIGDDSGGNPLCIDMKQGDALILLDHEYEDYGVSTFVNSSLSQLYQFLLLWQESQSLEAIDLEIFRPIDPPALEPDTYWHQALHSRLYYNHHV